MRAILINPYDKTVTEIEIDDKNINPSIYAAIGQTGFDIARIGPNVDCFVDDIGMFRVGQHYWCFTKCGAPSGVLMAGNGVMLTRRDADHVALVADVNVDNVDGHIMWLGNAQAAEASIQMGHVDRPETAITRMDKNMQVTGRDVIWRWTPAAEGTLPTPIPN